MTAPIRLADAGKRYVKYEDLPLLVTRALRFRSGSKRRALWAVRHVDLEVGEAETVGVIGRNGSGKSTMLRMLAGVTAPTEGSVSVRGRVAPLISVGVGFHQELTGRENVFVNGTILGLSRDEIERRFDQIVDFAEIADFIDTPVKFYSSGMFVRLGFAVAVAARPDVLLVDEVLAVGDFSFQAKCFTRMAEIQNEGTSILVVSHNLNAIRRLCTRALVLHDGQPRFVGDSDAAIGLYHDLLSETSGSEGGQIAGGEAPVEVLDFTMVGPDGTPAAHVDTGDDVAFRMRVRFTQAVEQGAFGIQILTGQGETAFAHSNYPWGARPFAAGEEAECDVRLRMMLAGGSYIARGSVRWGGRPETQTGSGPAHFFVGGRPMVRGIADLHASFEVAAGGELTPMRAPAPNGGVDDAAALSAAGGVPIFGGPLTAPASGPMERDLGAATQGSDAPGSDVRPEP